MFTEFDRNESILLALLSRLKGWTVRTKIVKLAYMMDNEMFGQAGVRATEFDYKWDNYGPNDSSNSIVKTLDSLIERKVIEYAQTPNPFRDGDTAHNYKVNSRVAPELPLTADDWVFVYVTIKKWGAMTASDLAAESKTTLPFKNAKQGDRLEFVRDPAVLARQRALMAKHGDFIRARAAETESLTLETAGVRLDDLRLFDA